MPLIKEYSKPDLETLFKWRVQKPLNRYMLAPILEAQPPSSLTEWTKEEEDRL